MLRKCIPGLRRHRLQTTRKSILLIFNSNFSGEIESVTDSYVTKNNIVTQLNIASSFHIKIERNKANFDVYDCDLISVSLY